MNNSIEKQPYFMQNKNWYNVVKDSKDILNVRIELTEKAPLKAVESYKKYIKEQDNRLSIKR